MRRVAVIGAGASGLTATKECLDYEMVPVCFEQSEDIAGLWRYRPEATDGEASIMRSTVINSSKEISAFSDFPPDPSLPFYMHNSGVLSYLRSYAAHFNLLEHIRFNTKVIYISQADDYDETGRWKVTYCDRFKDKTEVTEIFDAVLLCTGHHTFPYVPELPGLDKFKGKVMHSRYYKEPRGYENKRVLVVGMGNSGGDIAVELTHVASQVYLYCRRGNWVTSRIGPQGYPFDLLLHCRTSLFLHTYAKWFANYFMEGLSNQLFDHHLYNLKPKHRWIEQHVFVNDHIANCIASGRVKVVREELVRFGENDVEFMDDVKLEDIDVVIMATGYTAAFPFLAKDLIPLEDNETILYKHIFPLNLKHPTLCCIGLVQPLGSVLPISEMQCRVACSVLTGHIKLPPHEKMVADAVKQNEYDRKHFVASRRHTFQVNYVSYMDELASMIHVRPNLFKECFFHYTLYLALILAGSVPYQYRIEGIHANPDRARQNVRDFWSRTMNHIHPKRNTFRQIHNSDYLTFMWYMRWFFGSAMPVVLMLWFIRELVGYFL